MDNTKQTEMRYFHCGPSRQEKMLIRLDQNQEKMLIRLDQNQEKITLKNKLNKFF